MDAHGDLELEAAVRVADARAEARGGAAWAADGALVDQDRAAVEWTASTISAVARPE